MQVPCRRRMRGGEGDAQVGAGPAGRAQAAGASKSLVPASMRRLAVAGVVYRTLSDDTQLSAPVHLALRRVGPSATAARFRATVRQLVGQTQVPGNA